MLDSTKRYNALLSLCGILQVLIQFDMTNLTSDLSEATFAIIPDTYRTQQISFVNSAAADLGE